MVIAALPTASLLWYHISVSAHLFTFVVHCTSESAFLLHLTSVPFSIVVLFTSVAAFLLHGRGLISRSASISQTLPYFRV